MNLCMLRCVMLCLWKVPVIRFGSIVGIWGWWGGVVADVLLEIAYVLDEVGLPWNTLCARATNVATAWCKVIRSVFKRMPQKAVIRPSLRNAEIA